MNTRLLIRGTAALAAALLAFYSPGAHAQGSLHAWGSDYNGLVSNVPAGNDFVKVSLAGSHGLALRSDGTLASWGADDYGTVSGTPSGTFVDISAGPCTNAALRADGTIVAWGYPPQWAFSGTFANLSANFSESVVAIRPDGTLAYGYPQTTMPSGIFVSACEGAGFGVAIRANGELASWGQSYFVTFPTYMLPGSFRAVSAGMFHIVAVRADGTIAQWGDDENFPYFFPAAPTGTFSSVAASASFNVGLRTDGTLVTWGMESSGIIAGTPSGNGYIAVAATGETAVAIHYEPTSAPDADSDGLTNAQEALIGTNPLDSDSDDDGLLDGAEVNGSLTNPLDADSDNDGLSDGAEVGVGTNPNNADTDGDQISDAEDPTPLTPGVPGSWIEQRLRGDASYALGLPLECISAPNTNAAMGRRNAIGNKLTDAANKLALGDRFGAIDALNSLKDKLDGNASPPDWMLDCEEKDALYAEIVLMIDLLGQP